MSKKPTVVAAVNLGAVRPGHVHAALALRGLSLEGGLDKQVARLAAWIKEHTPKERIADCSTCGGESDVNDAACPFCGDGEVDVGSAPATVPATSGKAATEAPPEPEAPVIRRVVKRSIEAPLPPPIPTQIVSLPRTEEALDQQVAVVRSLIVRTADSLWELGTTLRGIFDEALWRVRRKEDGSETYSSWGQFCEAEFGFSHGYSLRLMDVSREFSREQVRSIGASKLHLTIQIPKGPARDRLLGIAPSVTKAELAVEVKKAAEAEETPARSTGRTAKGGAATHKAGPPRTGGRKPDKITIAALLQRVEFPLENGAGKRVKLKLPTGPLAASERLLNGVTQRFVVTVGDDGTLLLVVERTRE